MCIDHIRRAGTCEQEAHGFPVIKWMNFDGLQKGR